MFSLAYTQHLAVAKHRYGVLGSWQLLIDTLSPAEAAGKPSLIDLQSVLTAPISPLVHWSSITPGPYLGH
jgi:hypothetical protein